jgi:hypothetical protein
MMEKRVRLRLGHQKRRGGSRNGSGRREMGQKQQSGRVKGSRGEEWRLSGVEGMERNAIGVGERMDQAYKTSLGCVKGGGLCDYLD